MPCLQRTPSSQRHQIVSCAKNFSASWKEIFNSYLHKNYFLKIICSDVGGRLLRFEYWVPTGDKVMVKFSEGMPTHDGSFLFHGNKSHHISSAPVINTGRPQASSLFQLTLEWDSASVSLGHVFYSRLAVSVHPSNLLLLFSDTSGLGREQWKGMGRSLPFCPLLTLYPKSNWIHFLYTCEQTKGDHWLRLGVIFPLNPELSLVTLSFSCTDDSKEIFTVAL